MIVRCSKKNGSVLAALQTLLLAVSASPTPDPRVPIGRYGIACHVSGLPYVLGPPSYLVADIGRPGVPLVSRGDTALAKNIAKYFDRATLRFSFMDVDTGSGFIVYNGVGSSDVDPCSDNPGAYHVLNGSDNTYYEPGEGGDVYGIPGDAGLPTPGPWMTPSPSPVWPPPQSKADAASPAPIGTPLQVVWKLANSNAAWWRHVEVSQDGLTIVAGGDRISAFDARDGRVLWTRYGLSDPVLTGGRIIARTHQRVVALSGATGTTLWTKPIDGAGSVTLSADGDLVVIGFDPADYADAQREATTFGVSAQTGADLWQQHGANAFPGSRHFSFAGAAVVVGFGAFDEPSFGEVQLLDRRTGDSLLHVRRARYEGTFGDEIWLRATGGGAQNTLQYERYRNDGTALGAYRYNDVVEPYRAVLSGRYTFVARGNRIYRYDRSVSPQSQMPLRFTAADAPYAAIGGNLLFGSPTGATVLVATSPTKYNVRRLQLHAPFDDGVIANSLTVAYLSNQYTLVAVTDRGQAFPGDDCGNPSSIAFLPGGDVLAACEFTLVRYRLPQTRL